MFKLSRFKFLCKIILKVNLINLGFISHKVLIKILNYNLFINWYKNGEFKRNDENGFDRFFINLHMEMHQHEQTRY